MQPQKDFFVGIDSDGSVFDTMEIKQKKCFIPNIIKFWNLQPIGKYVAETVEFVNLYSRHRGMNRFPALAMVFDLLKGREEVKKANVQIPDTMSLKNWCKEETKLSNESLKNAAEKTGDHFLKNVLNWSEAVNKTISETVKNIPPFSFVKESLKKIYAKADIFVVSATPNKALKREWQASGISRYVMAVCGQEVGSKKEQIALVANGKYKRENMLMVGDAFGDIEAAKENGALFYPINPGGEDKSWERFYNEASDKFFDGEYAGDYELKLIEEFKKILPSAPPWRK